MEDTLPQPVVLFAGGGTGGHIYPNLAVYERLIERGFDGIAEFVISNRPIDQKAMESVNDQVVIRSLPVRPFSSKPWHWPSFLKAWNASRRELRQWDTQRGAASAIVTTGGFVSGPPIAFAADNGIPTAMVNLDAVPGLANRKMAKRATSVFSVYPHATLPTASPIGLPLRRSAVGTSAMAEARKTFGLNPDRPTLLITGGSQGAQSVNDGVKAWLQRDATRKALSSWQILHISGPDKLSDLIDSYAALGIPACVVDFCDTMGDAWQAATFAISRSGAGSVAEVWANATPTAFLPYPFHKDNHQRLNAAPIVATGGTLLLEDHIDVNRNADSLDAQVLPLLADTQQLNNMSEQLAATRPSDGADAVAQWILQQIRA